ncbi:MAG: hypothetical protein V3V25_05945 [Paracoccaceae bacterium]
MIDKKRILRAGATMVIAAGAGFFMQHGNAIAERNKAEVQSAGLGQILANPNPQQIIANFLPRPPSEAIMPFPLVAPKTANTSRVAALATPFTSDQRSDVETPTFLQGSCELQLTALPESGALVHLQLKAPCHQSQRILISHSGLEFADATNSDGTYSVNVPAMNEYSPFTISFSDGQSVDAKTLTLTLNGYERIAISWDGKPALHIHAMEYGAGFGETGHVWAQAARDPSVGVNAEGGFLVQLGNPDVPNPKLAEVYSFPFDRIADAGSVELLVEAEVTSQTCNTEIAGKSLQLTGAGDLTTKEIALTLPQCGGENGYLVLNNLFQDLKIAQN